jgi:hypothetical protein
LINVPLPRERLVGAVPIDAAYPKDYTPEQMRGWADDLERLNRTAPAELERWRRRPPEQLTAEQQRVLTAFATYCGESEARLKGALREDGTVDLENGRHRVRYMQERGVDPVPVWVWAADQRQLDRLSAQCEQELARRPAREVPPARVAPGRSPDTDQHRDEAASDRVR